MRVLVEQNPVGRGVRWIFWESLPVFDRESYMGFEQSVYTAVDLQKQNRLIKVRKI